MAKRPRTCDEILTMAQRFRIDHLTKIDRLQSAVDELRQLREKEEWTEADRRRVAELFEMVQANR